MRREETRGRRQGGTLLSNRHATNMSGRTTHEPHARRASLPASRFFMASRATRLLAALAVLLVAGPLDRVGFGVAGVDAAAST